LSVPIRRWRRHSGRSKTFAAHGLHGLSLIVALTDQHTRGVTAVHVVPVDFLCTQIDASFDDFRIAR
jgi:hydroxymethylpyrimidine/phosphomethylpyrimidine kinase